jgi:hypothetical protein
MTFAIRTVENIELDLLGVHPDALAIPTGKDDRAILSESIGEVGLLEPLTVIKGGPGYLVIDGVGRLMSASNAEEKIESLPCLVAECDDVRRFVLNKNPVGRKRSTGSRLMCYALAHEEQCLSGYLTSIDPSGRRNPSPEIQKWMPGAIAERLECSRKDVSLTCELLRCYQRMERPDGEQLDPKGREKMRKTFNRVIKGELPIRRWKAAFAGEMEGTQKGENGKANADYAGLTERSFGSLNNAFDHWTELKWTSGEQKARVGDAVCNAIGKMPDALRERAIASAVSNWPEGDLKVMAKMIKQRFGK